MNLKNLQKNWNEFGKTDPLWAILTGSDKKGKKWKTEEFFKTGVREVDSVMKYAESLSISISHRRALDFGCGVGRLTQALTNYFDEVYGVDIAPSMIKLANKYNKYEKRCHYFLNEVNDLKLFEDNSFDFIYSNIVLQHMEPEYSKNYIKEFLRILTPEGIAIFQIPSEFKNDTNQHLSSVFKAHINLTNPTSTMEAGSQTVMLVEVKNVSDGIWHASDQINLGNHWLDEKENIIINDDARSTLPRDCMPGDKVELSLIVTPPHHPGIYILELDMVKEHVTWFKDQGSETMKFNVEIVYSDAIKQFIYSKVIIPEMKMYDSFKRLLHRVSAGEINPTMEMHGVKKSDVIDLIIKNGGRLINVQEDYSSGKGWLSFRYCITK